MVSLLCSQNVTIVLALCWHRLCGKWVKKVDYSVQSDRVSARALTGFEGRNDCRDEIFKRFLKTVSDGADVALQSFTVGNRRLDYKARRKCWQFWHRMTGEICVLSICGLKGTWPGEEHPDVQSQNYSILFYLHCSLSCRESGQSNNDVSGCRGMTSHSSSTKEAFSEPQCSDHVSTMICMRNSSRWQHAHLVTGQ